MNEETLQFCCKGELVAKGNTKSQGSVIFRINECGVCLHAAGSGAVEGAVSLAGERE